MKPQLDSPPWPRLPLWIVAAAVLAFLSLGALLFGRDWRREQDYLREMYLWRGEALINSLEILGRARPNEPWAAAGLQNFWESLEDEEQILFIALTDDQGRLLASAGRLHPPSDLLTAPSEEVLSFPESLRPKHRLAKLDGRRLGLVYRDFRTLTRGRYGPRPGLSPRRGFPDPPVQSRLQAWVGFDLTALDRLGAARGRSAALSIGLVCLAGLAAILALFGAYNTRLARRLYQEARTELARKERLAALGSLAAVLAHEVRNPLGAIGGLCQHLLAGSPAEGRDREALEVMLASVARLNRAVTDFLNYARPVEIKTAPLDLGALVGRTSALVGHDVKAGAVELALDLPAEPVWIEGDEPLLAQAFLNLYLNAIEAAGQAPGGGRLEVALKKAERKARLTFRDNGPGFSPEQLARPFTPYFTTKAEGTGLGLALVEKTVRAHPGGTAALESSPAGGAAVILTFNLSEARKNA